MNITRVQVVAVTTASLLALTACGGTSSTGASPAGNTSPASTGATATSGSTGSAAPATSSAGGASATSVPKLPGVHLTMWTAQASATEADQVIGAFEKATGATVEKVVIPDPYETNVPTKFASGAKPDLMFYQPSQNTLAALQYKKNLLPLDNEPWVSRYAASVKQQGIIDGTRYAAIVTSPSVIGVYYNKADFAKAGITTMPVGYDELIADAKKLKAAGITPFYEAGADKWPLAWQVAVQLAEPTKDGSLWPALNANKDKWTNPVFTDAITKYQSVIQQGLVNSDYKTGTFVNQGTAVYDGTAAMAVQLDALLSEIQAKHTPAEIDKNLGFFPISAKGSIATNNPDQTNAVVLLNTGNKQRQDGAKALLNFWLGADYPAFIAAAKTTSIETGVDSPAAVPQIARTISASLANSVPSLYIEPVAHVDLYLYLADMLYGKKTPQQVAKASQDEFTQEATAQGVPGF
ncbi:MAG: raffinose/stachyose/melibiose transport system substrate-binding protein [Frankiales bacterium]|nr:raffinose/stachyose/melibiose transport system substrate-binding protein [Frankiales bacterium]